MDAPGEKLYRSRFPRRRAVAGSNMKTPAATNPAGWPGGIFDGTEEKSFPPAAAGCEGVSRLGAHASGGRTWGVKDG